MLNDLYIRLRSLFRPRTVDNELNEELRFHMEQQSQKYQRAGLTAEEAQRRLSSNSAAWIRLKRIAAKHVGWRLWKPWCRTCVMPFECCAMLPASAPL